MRRHSFSVLNSVDYKDKSVLIVPAISHGFVIKDRWNSSLADMEM